MERKVPNPRIGAQAIEDRRARQRRVHHDQAGNLVPVRLRVDVGDHQPDIVADQHDRSLDP